MPNAQVIYYISYFLSLGILQHHAKYNSNTTITLEKLLGVGFFDTIVVRLAHY
jgi:hypothetical protein